MEDKICALLVHDARGDHLSSLRRNLDKVVGVAKTCGEAAHYLQKPNPPHLVFTDTAMPDGTWQDVLKLAAKAPRPVNVIVVARDANFKMYIEAREQGAFDLIATSTSRPLVAEALEGAAADVFQRREVQELLMLG